ncbi:MAG: UDP-N-acetylmuramate dehydrogenase [Armatimonadetes bacterium]|nr:UDP-N-acetylmuramate dehydrogenase [Armatimonadota bacterium]
MTAPERADLTTLAADLGADVQFDRPLAELTTWRIGGPADVVLQPHTRAALRAAVAWCRDRHWPCRLLGNGSNLLAPDDGVAGVVVHLANQMAEARWDGTRLDADAGCFLPKLAREAADRGLSGLECVVGVPGTVGGGCVTNAGIPSGTLGDVLLDVDVLLPDGSVRRLTVDEMALGHRESVLRHEPWLALGARFDLRPDEPQAVRARLSEHLAYRRRTQPLSLPSCGSVFRRPAAGFPGALVEAAGCKGLRRGEAQVSELHANWIVNLGAARAADVLWLIDTVRERVRAQSGVELVLEVQIWSADR